MKRIYILCMLMLLSVVLQACEKELLPNTLSEVETEMEDYTSEEITEIEDDASDEIAEAEKNISEEYREQLKLYAQSYENWQGFEEWDGAERTFDKTAYAICDLDNNGVLELIVSTSFDTKWHSTDNKFYTISDQTVVELSEGTLSDKTPHEELDLRDMDTFTVLEDQAQNRYYILAGETTYSDYVERNYGYLYFENGIVYDNLLGINESEDDFKKDRIEWILSLQWEKDTNEGFSTSKDAYLTLLKSLNGYSFMYKEEKEIIEAYKEVLEQDKYLESGHYQLIYLNDDDIPELAIICGFAHVSGADIYAYIDGKAVQLKVAEEEGGEDSFGQWGSLLYNEREGQVWSEYSRNGGAGEYGFICQWDGENSELELLQRYEVDIHYERGSSSEWEEAICEYFIDEQSVSVEKYREAFEAWGEKEHFNYDDGIVLSEEINIEQSLYEAYEANRKTTTQYE